MTCGWIAGGLAQTNGYDWSRQEISDLGALTAQHAWIWNAADSLSGLLVLIFAAGLYRVVRSDRAGRIGSVALGIVGAGSILDGLLREDCPLSTSASCQRLQDGPGLSWHHQAHDIESVAVVIAILVAGFALASAFRRVEGLRGLRSYTLATSALMLVATAAYVALYGNAGAGIAQRLLVLAFTAWIAILSLSMLKLGDAGGPNRPDPADAGT